MSEEVEIYAEESGKREFTPPPAGTHLAVCVDLEDVGLLPNRFEPDGPPVPTIYVYWQINELMDNSDKRYLVRQDYRKSLNEKANFRKMLDAWIGPLSPTDLSPFRSSMIIGKSCLLTITHKTSQKSGKVWASVRAAVPLPKGMMAIEPENYKRPVRKVRPTEAEDPDESDVPF